MKLIVRAGSCWFGRFPLWTKLFSSPLPLLFVFISHHCLILSWHPPQSLCASLQSCRFPWIMVEVTTVFFVFFLKCPLLLLYLVILLFILLLLEGVVFVAVISRNFNVQQFNVADTCSSKRNSYSLYSILCGYMNSKLKLLCHFLFLLFSLCYKMVQ